MIGSNLARSLVEEGNEVVGVDNLWRGAKKNIEDLLLKNNFQFRHADLISDTDWAADINSCDTIIHIADIVAGIGYVFSNEWSIFAKNLAINSAVAKVVNSKEPALLIYLGTACSYPQRLQRSVADSGLVEGNKFPADPESGYGWSKLVGEIEFNLVIKNGQTKFITLDLHNVYGWPCIYADKTAQVIPSLIYKAITSVDNKLSVWGNGKQGRAFLHTSDVVVAIKRALVYEGSYSNFMIGPGSCTTIREIAEIIKSHPSINIDEITYDITKPTGDIGRFSASSLAKEELGWAPLMDISQGLNLLIDRVIDDWS